MEPDKNYVIIEMTQIKNKKKMVRKILNKVFWPFCTFFVVLFFMIVPIIKNGFWAYIGIEKEINPLIRKIADKYVEYHSKQLSNEWFNRVKQISEEEIPLVEWEEDSITSKGINSFYCLDQQSDDVRPLLIDEWKLPYDKQAWWNSHKSGEYLLAPELSPSPIYNIVKTDSTLHIKTGTKYDTWIYLVSKHLQPSIYSLEFDFISHTQTQETLQIDFAASSLASRFRFNLENNQTLKFDIVDHGYFLYWPNVDLWEKHKKQCTIPIGKTVHVKLVCINNIFALYYDDALKMAVEVDKYLAKPSYWFIILWNGTPNYEKNQDKYMDIEIKNFKISHQKKSNDNMKKDESSTMLH